MKKSSLSPPPRFDNKRKGFTLIELIIVIVIIAILAAIAIPAMNGYIDNSKQAKSNANAKIIYDAAMTAQGYANAVAKEFADTSFEAPVADSYFAKVKEYLGDGIVTNNEIKIKVDPESGNVSAVFWRTAGNKAEGSSVYKNGSPDFGSYPQDIETGNLIVGTGANANKYLNANGDVVIDSTSGNNSWGKPAYQAPFIDADGKLKYPVPIGANWRFLFSALSLKVPPIIPEGISDLSGTFSSTLITSPPVLPTSTKFLLSTFQSCTALKTAPIIPAGVENLNSAFVECRSLTGSTITFLGTPTSVVSMLTGVSNVTLRVPNKSDTIWNLTTIGGTNITIKNLSE